MTLSDLAGIKCPRTSDLQFEILSKIDCYRAWQHTYNSPTTNRNPGVVSMRFLSVWRDRDGNVCLLLLILALTVMTDHNLCVESTVCGTVTDSVDASARPPPQLGRRGQHELSERDDAMKRVCAPPCNHQHDKDSSSNISHITPSLYEDL